MLCLLARLAGARIISSAQIRSAQIQHIRPKAGTPIHRHSLARLLLAPPSRALSLPPRARWLQIARKQPAERQAPLANQNTCRAKSKPGEQPRARLFQGRESGAGDVLADPLPATRLAGGLARPSLGRIDWLGRSLEALKCNTWPIDYVY